MKEPRKSILSKIGGLFKKKSKDQQAFTFDQKDISEGSGEETDTRVKEKQAFEIESDEEEDDLPLNRDIVRRITLLKDQFDKFNIPDDFNFAEIYKSVVDLNNARFDFSENPQ